MHLKNLRSTDEHQALNDGVLYMYIEDWHVFGEGQHFFTYKNVIVKKACANQTENTTFSHLFQVYTRLQLNDIFEFRIDFITSKHVDVEHGDFVRFQISKHLCLS